MSCGSIIYSLIFAFFTYLFFEAPFASLIKCTIVERLKTKDSGGTDTTNGNQMNVIHVLGVQTLNPENVDTIRRADNFMK